MNIRALVSIALILPVIGLKAGHPSFTFNQVAGDGKNTVIECDSSGNILKISDGKKTPLVLGSIPYKKSHIELLKRTFSKKSDNAEHIGLVTLTESWESDAAGLSGIVKENKKIAQRRYPTKDGTPPSFTDILQAVHDLENRDTRNEIICLVHCRYGRGRSALVVAAYIAYVLHKNGVEIKPHKIEAYLVSRRSKVRLHTNQKKALAFFCSELKKAGSFENLYYRYKN